MITMKRRRKSSTGVTPTMPGVSTVPSIGSHLPVLIHVMGLTSGPVLELGSGLYSTPYLHWACFTAKRTLVTYESDPAWFDFARQFARAHHAIVTLDDLDTADLSAPWSVAFVDYCQEGFRRFEAIRKLTHVEYVVAHDAETRANHHYWYSRITPLFKYRYDFTAVWPPTAVFSNHHDVTRLRVAEGDDHASQ
jgi:predicted O-methyltransferase YrrM